MTQAEAPVLIEVRNRVGYLTLNRPAGLNAVTGLLGGVERLEQRVQILDSVSVVAG